MVVTLSVTIKGFMTMMLAVVGCAGTADSRPHVESTMSALKTTCKRRVGSGKYLGKGGDYDTACLGKNKSQPLTLTLITTTYLVTHRIKQPW